MTGSQMAGFGVFLLAPSLIVAAIFTLLGLAFPGIGAFCFIVALMCACFAEWIWGSIKAAEITASLREERDRANFATSNPGLHTALVAIATLCSSKPGYKRIRFHTETSRGMPGDEDIVVYVVADTWSEEGANIQPISVAGVPAAEWKNGFPAMIGSHSVGIRFVSSPISLGWPGGVSAGIWQ